MSRDFSLCVLHSTSKTDTAEVRRAGGAQETQRVGSATRRRRPERVVQILLHGVRGCGKSALAAHVAKEAAFSYAQVLTSDMLLSERPADVPEILRTEFESASREPQALLLLDDLDGILEHVPVAGSHSWNSQRMTTLQNLLRRSSTNRNSNSMLLIATATSEVAREFPSLTEQFDVVLELPPLKQRSHLAAVIMELGGIAGTEDMELALLALQPEMPMGIGPLIKIVELSKDDEGVISLEAFQDHLKLRRYRASKVQPDELEPPAKASDEMAESLVVEVTNRTAGLSWW
ncbi:hypothetical protein CYMTET_11612 [Cymbomonas tetramitiformis]|uniref:Vesicle-fusing ATPase n=1 Tax=Cymbomonas tetramitiformis TaxID=36881 RepID=A0AAE0GNC9_9CHLO|nr:hypothetical protein CYMTET_11612 [Cymbomonas tetramitiformis]